MRYSSLEDLLENTREVDGHRLWLGAQQVNFNDMLVSVTRLFYTLYTGIEPNPVTRIRRTCNIANCVEQKHLYSPNESGEPRTIRRNTTEKTKERLLSTERQALMKLGMRPIEIDLLQKGQLTKEERVQLIERVTSNGRPE
jgi:hypothetical protein